MKRERNVEQGQIQRAAKASMDPKGELAKGDELRGKGQMNSRKKARERAKGLVEQMTVEEMVSQLKFDAPAIERLNIAAYNWWNEGLHGVARAGTATVFPQAIAMAASWNRALLFRMGEAVALEARAKYNASRAHGDRDIYKG